ncbi:MAG: hypothetical protein CL792_03985 [Chloroflexi bacterium]|nr:hypothetical protein [Chloroflexota bacterium]
MNKFESKAKRTALIVMLGGFAFDNIEGELRRSLEASACDLLNLSLEADCFDYIALATDRLIEQSLPEGIVLSLDRPGKKFQFGERLYELLQQSECEQFVYIGAGSAPLISADDLIILKEKINSEQLICITNNYFSADFFALNSSDVFTQLSQYPSTDNEVPRALKEELNVYIEELPRNTITQFNIDSPLDLVTLNCAAAGGPLLRRSIAKWDNDSNFLSDAAKMLNDSSKQIFVSGRVGSYTWQYLERQTACRVRMLSEERGMGAAGADGSLRARSLLGQVIESVGANKCFTEWIPVLCDAAFIDIRPVLAHLKWSTSVEDRFNADLLRPHKIQHSGLKDLVIAAKNSSVPVIIGGHSLVSGDLMLLNDWVWSIEE